MTCKPDDISGLDSLVIKKLYDVFVGFPKIEKVVIFGSRALGTYKAGSDIDLCLYGENITVKGLLEIRCRLEELMLPYKTDTIIYHRIDNQELISHIDRVGVGIYGKEKESS